MLDASTAFTFLPTRSRSSSRRTVSTSGSSNIITDSILCRTPLVGGTSRLLLGFFLRGAGTGPSVLHRPPPLRGIACGGRAALRQRVHGGREPVVCCDLLETSLVVLVARALGGLVDAFAELLEDEATDGSTPPSRYIAPSTASTASARIDAFSRPPEASSPLPRRRSSPTPSSRPTSASVVDETTAARALASCPSGRSGKAENRWSVTTTPSTASPKNSSRSFDSSPGCSAHHDRCVRA